jgi:RND family efflux transporter MFP subunit
MPVAEAPGAAAPAPAATTAAEPKANAPSRSGAWVLGTGGLVAVALAGSLVAATLPRLRQEKALDSAASGDSPPVVTVAPVHRASSTSELTLPGNAQAYRGAGLYARTNGYLKRWLVDIGDRVKEGQLIAEISAPDVDDQLAQAKANLVLSRANLKVSEANLELAKVTLERDLRTGTATAPLVIDQDRAQVTTAAAQVESSRASIQVNEATVQQYADLVAFQRIVAPFAGVITARTVDPGALVTADNPSETRPLFYVMQTDPLRVFVNVPQTHATTIAVGQNAVLYRQEDPGRQFSGRVTRTADALDPNTRTLLTQVDVPNPDGSLRPGMYLQVKFAAARAAPVVLVPSAALVWRPQGPVVPVLDKDNRVRYRPVQVGRDFGLELEVVTGLQGDENVIVHPGDALAEGQEVQPAPPAK